MVSGAYMGRTSRLVFTSLLLLVFSGLGIWDPDGSAQVHKATFKGGASSTGWIDFDFYDGKQIFIPATINGHDTMVLLATGLPIPDIDKAFAAAVGLEPTESRKTEGTADHDTTNSIGGVQIQIGALTLPVTTASVVDLTALSEHIGHSLPVLLGDDAFKDLVVDIDFAHRRMAISDPSNVVKPAGAVEVPLIRVQNEHLVPVSIEGATPTQFELGLGNSGEILVYESYYLQHKLVEGRRTSRRLAAGTGGFVPETVATLGRVEFAGVELGEMPAAFIPSSLTGGVSKLISGDIGLPILARFRLIIDYSHDRLYAMPYAEAARTPFPKDRLGLTLNKQDAGFAVRFVAPNSPAQTAGFKIGDEVELIDGNSIQAWNETALTDLKYGRTGTNLAFTMKSGSVRQVKLADYF